ncbi:eukaryotic translation initiation factor 2A-like [Bolinopsis microptera]|uniref:eukaryotic translation initiation factor 2A-like n=1 Tax=Bolinopsis microptera TaxID=2820187 RepID=UPI00307973A0
MKAKDGVWLVVCFFVILIGPCESSRRRSSPVLDGTGTGRCGVDGAHVIARRRMQLKVAGLVHEVAVVLLRPAEDFPALDPLQRPRVVPKTAQGTLFNVKCDPIHEFGENHYNEILFNPQGNMVGLCGFGNLRGKIKFYETENNKLLSDFVAADATFFEWAPCGDVFITGTLSPRLRQDNEFKLWDVSGKILHHYQVPTDETQLWQLMWINPAKLLPPPVVPRPATSKEIAAGKPQAYRPPGSRQGPAAATRSLLPNVQGGVYKPGSDAQRNQPSRQAQKNQRKRENRAKQIEDEKVPAPTMQDLQSTIVDEREKKVRNLKKKLHQIEKLKGQVAQGKTLEKNQMDKIASENDLIEEIKRLEL